ncbi:MAG: trigger factor [Spirochaetaceae bacterium]|nr:trigger factor [Spirochaetaceae bacterium]
MPISNTITRLEHSAVRLTLTVEKDDVRARYAELVNEYLKSAAIPGFRKGKVPREVLERKFGPVLKDETINKIFSTAITEVFEDESFPKENRPLPYSTPRLEGDEPVLDPDKDLSFSVVYDVLPAVTVGPWKGLEVEIPNVTVEEEDIRRELEEIRERSAVVLDRDDGEAAAKDDVVTINYTELDGGGNPVQGSERQDFVFTLGSGYNLYQFDDDLTGMKKGETRDITKTFPADYTQSELAGKTLTIRVTLTALKEKKLPDLDDDLAQDVDEKYTTLEDLKNSIRERLAGNLNARIRDITVSKILEKVLESTPIDLPESMITLELDSRFRNLARRFNTGPEELAQNLIKTGQDPEKLREDWKPDAEKVLKSRIIVETLLQDLNLEASEEEVRQEIQKLSNDSDTSPEEIKKYYEQENVQDYLRENIKERKLFDLFIAENNVKKGKKETYPDLMSGKG